jgi:hypothetical protein
VSDHARLPEPDVIEAVPRVLMTEDIHTDSAGEPVRNA